MGDIDILGIDKEKHQTYFIETKNFFYLKDFNELSLEIEDMFGSRNRKRKSYLELEMGRYKWVVSHIDDVKKRYKLDNKEWKVEYTFLTRSPLISCVFTNHKINHIDIGNISLKYIRKLE